MEWFKLNEIITLTAILGRALLPPGTLPVTVASPAGECHVAHAFPAAIESSQHNLKYDVSDCTLFTVTHLNKIIDETSGDDAEELLEQALQAISEVIIWYKSRDSIGKVAAFTRQVGRTDVKIFLIQASGNKLIGWENPLFWINHSGAALIAGLFGNALITNGPSSSPVSPVIRRVMSSQDLINLGFYTESFVNLFSLVDDLTQEVLKAGLAKKGIEPEAQKSFLRAIKEERLKLYLTHFPILCGWTSLDNVDPKLFKDLLKANSLRNSIMHGSTRLTRSQAVESTNTLLSTIAWLITNPFNYFIPALPVLRLAEAVFTLQEASTESEESVD